MITDIDFLQYILCVYVFACHESFDCIRVMIRIVYTAHNTHMHMCTIVENTILIINVNKYKKTWANRRFINRTGENILYIISITFFFIGSPILLTWVLCIKHTFIYYTNTICRHHLLSLLLAISTTLSISLALVPSAISLFAVDVFFKWSAPIEFCMGDVDDSYTFCQLFTCRPSTFISHTIRQRQSIS